ncbi:DUF6328 family protein [Streptomyces flaveolus]|uniref:DUF6328 family protein n=1 Tax=Streptomyces flaveolus TaxID=67297 RepID=UPI0036F94BD8
MRILFAFPLSLASTSRFPELDTVRRTVRVTTLLFTVLAAMLFTSPSRAAPLALPAGRQGTVRVSSRLATVGMGALVFAFTGSVMLVVDVTTGRAGGTAAGAATLLGCLGLWRLLPRPGPADPPDR